MKHGDHRICFVGDSFVQGTCDQQNLGWPGRVTIAARKAGCDVTAYNLGVRRDTSADISKRWRAECSVRFREGCENRIVFSFGANDMTLENGTLRVGESCSLANFRSILSAAKSLAALLVIGPLPVGDAAQDGRISSLCRRYAGIAGELGVPYLPLAEMLINDEPWQLAVSNGDGTHPDGHGYALIANHIMQWPAWWFTPARSTD